MSGTLLGHSILVGLILLPLALLVGLTIREMGWRNGLLCWGLVAIFACALRFGGALISGDLP